MPLSSELISQFVKATKSTDNTKKEATVYGTTVEYNGKTYVKLDGSDLLTPISTTTNTKPDERVTVMIKNHTATVTGNISSPAARTGDVEEVSDQVTEVEILIAHSITTDEVTAINGTIDNLQGITIKYEDAEFVNAEIENLKAKFTETDHLTATDIEAINAQIERLEATFGEFTSISTEDLDAAYAEIDQLKAYTGDFTYVSTEVLNAVKADVKTLNAEKLSAAQANLMYANIDFSNIGKAAMEKFYADSGLIRDVVVGDGTITGHLVGVTISGDLIEGNTIKADKIVVKDGESGLYYKLNFASGNFVGSEAVPDDSLHGSIITANSITAEKIRVDDLVAFDATIGGFEITKDSIHSVFKESVDNTISGLYMDKTGQMALGDDRNFIKYYLDEETGDFKLEISADSILLSSRSKSIEEAFDELEETVNNLEIGTRNLLVGTGNGYGWLYHTIDLASHALTIQNGDTSVLSNGLRTYSAYSRVVNGVFKFDGMSSRLEDTTLVLSGEPKTMSIYNGESPISLDAGQTYTLSFYANRDNDSRTVDIHIVDAATGHAEHTILERSNILSGYGEFSRFTYTFTPTNNHDKSVLVRFDLQGGTGPTTTLTVKDIKLEQGTVATDWTAAPEDVDRNISDVMNATDQIRSEMVDQRTEIINTCTEIIMSAVESRVEIDDYGAFKSSVESQLRVMAESIDMNFKKTESRVDGVDDKFVELYKYISFSQDGITIGSGDSTITLTLDNDGIVFSKSGNPFGRWDGTDFYTGNIILEMKERAQFGDFAFIPDDDGLSFYKVR